MKNIGVKNIDGMNKQEEQLLMQKLSKVLDEMLEPGTPAVIAFTKTNKAGKNQLCFGVNNFANIEDLANMSLGFIDAVTSIMDEKQKSLMNEITSREN